MPHNIPDPYLPFIKGETLQPTDQTTIQESLNVVEEAPDDAQPYVRAGETWIKAETSCRRASEFGTYEVTDNFVGGELDGSAGRFIGDLGWATANGAGTGQWRPNADQAAPTYGTWRMETGANPGDSSVTYIDMSNVSLGSWVFTTAYNMTGFTQRWRFKLEETTNDYWLGFTTSSPTGLTVPNRHLGIMASAANANFQFRSLVNGSEELVDTGIALDSTYHDFELMWDGANWKGSIDGLPLVTIPHTFIPSQQIGVGVWAQNTTGVKAGISMNFFSMYGELGAPGSPTDGATAIVPSGSPKGLSDNRWVYANDWHSFVSVPGNGANNRMRDAFRQIGDYRPALGIFNGDLIELLGDNGAINYDVINDCERLSGTPWYHAIGNHEVNTVASTPPANQLAAMRAFLNGVNDTYVNDTWDYNIGDTVQDRGYYHFYSERTNCHHVILNSVEHYDPTPTTGGWYWDNAQEVWLQNFLDSLGAADRVAVYTHIETKTEGAYNNSDVFTRWRHLEGNTLHNMLVNCSAKIIGVFSGHRHTTDYTEVDGIHYIEVRNGLNGGSMNSDIYGTSGSVPLSFILITWEEAESTLHIEGFWGEPNRTLVVDN